jgi:hypothetical protein
MLAERRMQVAAFVQPAADHPDDVAATAAAGIGHHTHQTFGGAAVHQRPASGCDLYSEGGCILPVDARDAEIRAAEDSNGPEGCLHRYAFRLGCGVIAGPDCSRTGPCP